MQIKNNIRLLEWYTMAVSSVFFLPIMVPYARDQVGLSFAELMITEAAFGIAIVLFEVPSGWLSDVWKRKNVLILGSLTWSAGLILMLIASNFWVVLIAQSLFGVAVTFVSGTIEALLYDTLLVANKTDNYVKLAGRRKALGFYATAISCLLGGFLYELHPDLPVWAMLITYGGAAFLALAVTEPERHKTPVEGHPVRDMVKTVHWSLTGSNKDLGLIILFATVLFSATKVVLWAQQPYYAILHIPEFWFGILFAFGQLAAGSASHLSHKIFPSRSNVGVLIWAWGFIVFSCLASGLFTGHHAVILLMLASAPMFAAAIPKLENAINKRVKSDRRATVLSGMSLFRQLLSAPMVIAFGYGVDYLSIGHALIGLGIWVLVLGGIAIALQRLVAHQH